MGKIILENVPVPYKGQTLYGKVIHQEFGQFSFVQESGEIEFQFRLNRNETTGYFESVESSREDIPEAVARSVADAINAYYSEAENKMNKSAEFQVRKEGSLGYYAYPIIDGSPDFSHGKLVIAMDEEEDLKDGAFPSDNFELPFPKFVDFSAPSDVFPVPAQWDYVHFVKPQG